MRTCSLRAVERYGRPCRAARHYTTICMQPYYIRNMFHTVMVTMMVNERKNDGPILARWDTRAIDSVYRLQISGFNIVMSSQTHQHESLLWTPHD